MRRLIRTLDEVQPADASLVGGKAFNCARLKQAGIPVPDGIILTAEAMGTSLEIPELHSWLTNLSPEILLAVRSSAPGEDSVEHSFAGIHETRLNVSPPDVPEAVHACWASVVSPAALAYRRARHFEEDESPKTAVLIQRMIQPVAAGVAFTVNPVSGNAGEMLINAVQGLGEALVSGRVNPDEFTVVKRNCEIASKRIAETSVSLTDKQLRDLAELLVRIEALFGAAQDVEWCFDGAQFWFVQSRPVTTAHGTSKKDIQWTRANAREVLPDLASPMTIYWVADAIEHVQRKFYGKLLAPESELGRMTRVFYGRMFFNVDQIRYTCKLSGTAPAVVLRSLGHEGDIDPADERIQTLSLREIAPAIPDLARLMFGQLRIQARVRQQLDRTERYLHTWRSMDFGKLSDHELWAENRNWRPRADQELTVVFMLAAVSSYERVVQTICERVGMPYERLLHAHLAAGEKSVSSKQAFDLLRLAAIARKEQGGLSSRAFQIQFEEFLQLYGHRGLYESDIAIPRYVEDPSPLLFAIRSHLESPQQSDPDEIVKRQELEAAESWREFEKRLNAWQRLTLAPQMRWLLRRIKQYYVWRELIRSEMMRLALPMRRLHLEMARRFVERNWIVSTDDYFYLTLEDVDAVMDGAQSGPSLGAIVDRRKSEWRRLAGIELPMLIRESQFAALVRNVVTHPSTVQSGSELQGLCVSAGYAEGEVIVMHDPSEFSRMKRGAILVAPATDPSWTALFTLASGVIVEVGGVLSHASTVAREFGLPALANVKHATRILKTGDRVRLDATNGVVQLLN